MSEPDVTMTDYGLVVECAACAVLLGLVRTDRDRLRLAGVCFFIFLGLSAATGGTVHGFFPDEQSAGHKLLWRLTLHLVGIAAFSLWMAGAELIAGGRPRRWLALAGILQLALYETLVYLIAREFWTAFTIYLPGALCLLAGFCRRSLWIGAAGSVLSLVSCTIQYLHIGLHPVYFNHNALAHVVQAIALILIFQGIRGGMRSDFGESSVAQPIELSPRLGPS